MLANDQYQFQKLLQTIESTTTKFSFSSEELIVLIENLQHLSEQELARKEEKWQQSSFHRTIKKVFPWAYRVLNQETQEFRKELLQIAKFAKEITLSKLDVKKLIGKEKIKLIFETC